jgi:uncharacterized repeat protein (TIGR03803 family)
MLFLFVTTAIALPAQTFTSLASFNGDNGAFPVSMSLVQGINGDLYGTAPYGGANSGGTVFKVTPAGTVTTLYSFCAQLNCADGKTPLAGLVLATNGIFYGTTSAGGLNGDGTVFSITSAGTETTLHRFTIYRELLFTRELSNRSESKMLHNPTKSFLLLSDLRKCCLCVLLFEDKMAGTRALRVTKLHRAEFINESVAQLSRCDLFNRKRLLLQGTGWWPLS